MQYSRYVLKSSTIEVNSLEAELRALIHGEVRFDAGSRALYATDSSNYRQVPIGVVIPKDVDDVYKTIATCQRYGTPLLARGGGTSLAGQCCNIAVIIDMSKYLNKIIEIDPKKRLARVQSGTILDDLRHAAEHYQLTFGPDPATHNHCTLGGMIGNDSCGTHSVMAGKTVDNIEELETITYDGLRLRVGKTSDEELEQIINQGGRRGEIYARLRALRDKYADLIRERFPKIPRRVSGYKWPGWEDSAVPPDKVGDYLRDLRDLLERFGYRWAFYGHFGQGCIQKFRSFIYQAAELVVKYGGSFSGEHGDGQARAELLPRMDGDELVEAFNEFKAIWDPEGKMNPGKMMHPYRIDENLRLGTDYHPAHPQTHFSFIEDQGSLARATLRCIGVGKCRGMEGGTMCPSFMHNG